MFFSEFDLQILYKLDKLHIMLNALNCLSNCNDINRDLNAFNIDMFNVYSDSVIIISADFSNHV